MAYNMAKWPCFYEKINYSEGTIKWRCFFFSLVPLIFTTGYINSSLIYSNLITWALILLFLIIVFHFDAIVHMIFSNASSVPSIINIVYVKTKSSFYKVSLFMWLIFIVWKIAANYSIIYGLINNFLSGNPIETDFINISLWGINDGSGMIFLITPIFSSFILEKYLVGVSDKKFGYLIFILALYIIPPIVYFYSVVPIIGKITPPIFTFNGFMDLLRTISISGILVIVPFSLLIVLETSVKFKNRIMKKYGDDI